MSTLTSSIKNALAEAGIKNVTEVETVKNGLVCTGFQIDNGSNVKPVIYYSPEENIDAFVKKVIRVNESPVPEIDADSLISRERLLNNTVLCVQKQSNENLVKRNYLNLEVYIRLEVVLNGHREEKGSIKVTPQILASADLSDEKVFEAARKNSLKKATICTLAEALGAPEELFGEAPFYIGTYEDKCHGAGILAVPEIFHNFCISHSLDGCYIIPSSIEEILLLPMENVSPSELSIMVNEVNSTVVQEELWLEPVCYRYDDETREVTIASSFREEV